jgi:uncharacterized repeat protein (TIGR03803 family)
VLYELDTAGNYTVLHQFLVGFGPSKPEGELIRDSNGNFYGTTQYGGKANAGAVYELDAAGKLKALYSFSGGGLLQSGPNPGVILDSAGKLYGATAYASAGGMIYRLGSSRQETTLYSFLGAAGGTEPSSGVVRDPGGNLYGTTAEGGPANAGVVYKLAPSGEETVLHSFTGGADGAGPGGYLALDLAGNLYGTTAHGGAARGSAGFGVAYKIDTSGRQTVLHAFTGGADGGSPSGVVLDPAGNIYGTAGGGASGAGVVYKLDSSGHENVLHSFMGGADGGGPGSVTLDAAGNLYGTAYGGGTAGLGVVYKLDPSGEETILFSFPGGPAGAAPTGGVTRDPAGNLYGTTSLGGGAVFEEGAGVVFELSAAGDYSVLYAFTGGADGGAPLGGVIRDSTGNLYGTTSGGGAPGCISGCGVIFKLDRAAQQTVLYSFTGGTDGADPYVAVAESAGYLYGTTPWGGQGGTSSMTFSGAGVVYEIRLH